MKSNTKKPLEFSSGRAKVLAWANQSENGVWYSFTPKCLYQDKASGKLNEGTSFNRVDLVQLALSALLAFYWYSETIRSAEPAESDTPESKEDLGLILEATDNLRLFIEHRKAIMDEFLANKLSEAA